MIYIAKQDIENQLTAGKKYEIWMYSPENKYYSMIDDIGRGHVLSQIDIDIRFYKEDMDVEV